MSDESKPVPIAMGDKGIQLSSLEDAYRFAKYVIASGFAPSSMKKPEQVMVAMQAGQELGFTPMRSLSVVTVINGRPSLMGEAALALIRARGGLEEGTDFGRECKGEGDQRVCIATATMKGGKKVSSSFSVEDAKRARLWGKSGPWTDYPDRMLWWRAVGFLVMDHFSEYTMGLRMEYEVRDMPPAVVAAHVDEPLTDELLEKLQTPGAVIPAKVSGGVETIDLPDEIRVPEPSVPEDDGQGELL